MLKNFLSFLKEANGDWSCMRIMQLIVLIPVMFVWTYISLRNNAMTTFSNTNVALLGVIFDAKAVQKFGEG